MGTRRGNGEGSFRLRDDDRWEGSIRFTDSHGKPRRVSAYGATRKLAKKALDEKIDRINDGLAVVDSKSPLGTVARKWRTTTLVASDRRQATKDLYDNRCRRYIETGVLADIPLARLTPSDIERWIVQSRDVNNVADSSLRTDYAVLRAILDTAVRDGLVARNVAAQVPRPSVARREALHLTPAQVAELLDKVATTRYSAALVLIASTAMRRGEVLALRWRDVDLDEGVITVAGTLTGSGKKLRRETAAKTDSSHRKLPIGEAMVQLLRDRAEQREVERRRAANLWQDTELGLVFSTEFGTMVDPRNVLRTLQTAARKLDLPKGVGIHTLRHSAATALMASGAHLKLVSAILGHSDTSITADIYGHASDSAQRAVLDALHAQVSGPRRHLSAVPGESRADADGTATETTDATTETAG